MNPPVSHFSRRFMLACATLSLLSLPLVVRAQGSTPALKAPPMPATQSTAALTAQGNKAMAMSDSAKNAYKAEAEKQLNQMATDLKLTPEQKAKAKPILLDHAAQVKLLRDKYAVMEKTPATRDAMTKEMHSLRDATDGKLSGVLSADQLAHYKTMRDAQLAKMRSKMAGTEEKPAEKK